jgi:hypothetical protein
MEPIPKRIKRLVQEWAGVAHDRELTRALLELRGHFDRWQRGEIGPSDLDELIHKYHQGTARQIWKHYSTSHLEPAIAFCVVDGLLRRDELPPELREHIAGWIQFYESQRSVS